MVLGDCDSENRNWVRGVGQLIYLCLGSDTAESDAFDVV